MVVKLVCLPLCVVVLICSRGPTCAVSAAPADCKQMGWLRSSTAGAQEGKPDAQAHLDTARTAKQLYEAANKARLAKQADRAIELYTMAIELKPDYHEAYFWRGQVYYELKHDLSRAADSIVRAIELQPNNTEYLFYGGMFFGWGKNDYPRAFGYFDRAIALAPRYAEYVFQRGRLYCDSGNRPRGIIDISKAIELRPTEPMYLVTRAFYYQKDNKLAAARSDLRRAIQIDPNGYWGREARKRLRDLQVN